MKGRLCFRVKSIMHPPDCPVPQAWQHSGESQKYNVQQHLTNQGMVR